MMMIVCGEKLRKKEKMAFGVSRKPKRCGA